MEASEAPLHSVIRDMNNAESREEAIEKMGEVIRLTSDVYDLMPAHICADLGSYACASIADMLESTALPIEMVRELATLLARLPIYSKASTTTDTPRIYDGFKSQRRYHTYDTYTRVTAYTDALSKMSVSPMDHTVRGSLQYTRVVRGANPLGPEFVEIVGPSTPGHTGRAQQAYSLFLDCTCFKAQSQRICPTPGNSRGPDPIESAAERTHVVGVSDEYEHYCYLSEIERKSVLYQACAPNSSIRRIVRDAILALHRIGYRIQCYVPLPDRYVLLHGSARVTENTVQTSIMAKRIGAPRTEDMFLLSPVHLVINELEVLLDGTPEGDALWDYMADTGAGVNTLSIFSLAPYGVISTRYPRVIRSSGYTDLRDEP